MSILISAEYSTKRTHNVLTIFGVQFINTLDQSIIQNIVHHHCVFIPQGLLLEKSKFKIIPLKLSWTKW